MVWKKFGKMAGTGTMLVSDFFYQIDLGGAGNSKTGQRVDAKCLLLLKLAFHVQV